VSDAPAATVLTSPAFERLTRAGEPPDATQQTGGHPATSYTNRLLEDVGAVEFLPLRAEPHPALRWAQSGCMALTGYGHGPAQMCPVPLASYADGLVAALRSFAPESPLRNLDGAQLLGERAALSGYRRAGAIAAGGSCRLLRAADGWLAINLARETDWEMLPAWLEAGRISDWQGVATALKSRTVLDCLERGRLLGLAVAPEARPGALATPWFREVHRSGRRRELRSGAPLVVDLSSLWAGPLCTHLLEMLGARVVKVESTARSDGTRANSGFYELLNAGKASVTLDFTRAAGREQLRQLLLRADIVIEASRPRALRQLGIAAEEIVDETSVSWIAISGYGRDEPAANWIAFGDDAGVAAGLSRMLRDCTGLPMFCGDAVADPLTGLHAALLAWNSLLRGGGRLLSVALHDVVAHCIEFATAGEGDALRKLNAEWSALVTDRDVASPRARQLTRGRARAPGADTVTVLSELGIA